MHRVEGWLHIYRRNNGALYYVRRVPTDLVELIPQRQFKRSLKHKDHRLPAFKAVYDAVRNEVETYIAKLRRGLTAPEALRDYELAVLQAQRLGFDLRPISALASEATSVEDLIDRLIAVEKKLGNAADKNVDAVMGAVPVPSLSISEALERYVELSKPDLRGKNAGQRKRWRSPLDLAVGNFIAVVGAKSLDQITRDDALRFREWWIEERIGCDVQSANTANKNLMALRRIFSVVNDAHRLGLDNPFQGLSISEGPAAKRASLPRDWHETKMLTADALSGMNAEARGVVLGMAETGARVNEFTGLEAADVVLEADVPHIILRAN